MVDRLEQVMQTLLADIENAQVDFEIRLSQNMIHSRSRPITMLGGVQRSMLAFGNKICSHCGSR